MKRLLLLEADALFREGLALLLEWNMGLGSVQIGSVAEASWALADPHGKVDLAILDIDLLLNNGDATGLIEELRKVDPDVPVLAFTVSRSLEQRARVLQAGANEVLSMASSVEEIVGAARRLVSE